jgi:hypothetical protein
MEVRSMDIRPARFILTKVPEESAFCQEHGGMQ